MCYVLLRTIMQAEISLAGKWWIGEMTFDLFVKYIRFCVVQHWNLLLISIGYSILALENINKVY